MRLHTIKVVIYFCLPTVIWWKSVGQFQYHYKSFKSKIWIISAFAELICICHFLCNSCNWLERGQIFQCLEYCYLMLTKDCVILHSPGSSPGKDKKDWDISFLLDDATQGFSQPTSSFLWCSWFIQTKYIIFPFCI